MDKNYKITAVGPSPKDWSSTYGPMKTYRIKLDLTNDEVVELNKKADSPAPQVGDELFGHPEDSKNPEFPTRKFKVAYNKPNKPFTPYQESPEKQASIYRSVALNNAAVVYQGSGESAVAILGLADAFDEWLKKDLSPEVKKDDDIDLDALEGEEISLDGIPL